MNRNRMLLAAALLSTGGVAAAGPVVAAPGWIRQTPPAVTPAEARERLAAAVPCVKALSAADASVEIAELTRALRNDPRRIFDYVRNRIEYEPAYGSILGATATYTAGKGNDCDQASLLIALMRQAGFQARYVIGDVTYAPSRLAAWLGADESVAQDILVNGGVPLVGVVGGWQVTRVWTEVFLDGAWVTLDPAMKAYRQVASVVTNWNATLAYAPDAFLARTQAGATVDAHSAKNLNEFNVRSDLAAAATNLAAYLRQHHPLIGYDELVGGRRIVETQLGSYPTALPHALSVSNQTTYDTLPAALDHTLTVTHAQTPANTHTFNTREIAGKRLTLFWNGADMALYREGAPVCVFSGTPSNAPFTVRIGLDHPCGITQTHEFPLTSGAFSYAIACDLGDVSQELLGRRRERLERARRQGGAADAEAVRGEALSLLGLEWFRQVALFEKLVDARNHTRTISHHRAGVTGQGTGFFVDMPLMYTSTASTDALGDTVASGRVQTLMSSAFEHGVLLQLQDHGGWDSVSTIRLLQYGNETGGATYLANAANWNTGYAVRARLTNYEGMLDWLDAIIAAGYDLVLPQDGQLQIGSWRGTGFIQHYQEADDFGMGMIISGGYAGGYTTQPGVLDPGQRQWTQRTETEEVSPPKSNDPVDMRSGAFLDDHADLMVGPGSEPMGLVLRRTYSSADALSAGPLGNGWRHNHEQSAFVHSAGPAGLGPGGAVNAAAAAASVHVLLGLLSGESSALKWATASLVSKWAMDQLIDNAVTIRAGTSCGTFVKLPDGSFNPPAGSPDRLAAVGSGYQLKDHRGWIRTFGASGDMTALADSNGNTMTYAYDGTGRLAGVTDCFGKTLAFAYDGDGFLTGVSHGGRSVQYTCAGGNLVNFRDAAGADWGYAYDGSNRLASVCKAAPPTAARVVNVYDTLGRVKTQTDALGHTGAFFFSGYRNIEVFPDGAETEYRFDRDGRNVARVDAAGKPSTFAYDGLGRLIRITDRLGGATAFAYHPRSGRLAALTNANGHGTSWTYVPRSGDPDVYDLARVDYAGGSFESFGYDAHGNAVAHTDCLGKAWSATYNARGQTLGVTNPEGGVSTYGYNSDGTLASMSDSDVGATTFLYDSDKRLTRVTFPDDRSETAAYDANDRLTAFTDGEGRQTTFTYDANGNLIEARDAALASTCLGYNAMDRLVAATNRLGKVTRFAYDDRNRVAAVTDATGVTTGYGYDPRGWFAELTRAGRTWRNVCDDEGVQAAVVTPGGRTNAVTTDAMGNPVAFRNPLGQQTLLTRNADTFITAVTDPRGQITAYAPDAEGRLGGVTLPGGASATYVNNGIGLLSEIVDPNGSRWRYARTGMGRLLASADPLARTNLFVHDDRGRIAGMTWPDGATLSITRDGAGNLRRMLYSDGTDLQYDYDAVHRVVSANGLALTRDAEGRVVSTADGAAVCGAAYDDAGRLVTASCNGSAFTVTYAYATGPGGSGLLTGIWDNVTSLRVALSHDADGRLQTLRFSNGETITYTWDAADRLLRMQSGAQVDETLAYDAAGRIAGKQLAAPLSPGPNLAAESLGLAADAASQLVAPGYVHDAQGRVTATPEHALAWDGASRATAIDGVALAYNGLGQVRTRTAGGTTTRLLYNQAIMGAPLVAEQDAGTGQMLRYYVWTPSGRLLYLVDASAGHAVRVYHFDSTGSTLALTGLDGTVTDAYAYDPYGRLVARTGTHPQPFTFAGALGVRQEGAGGLYQMRARYYDARTGRFLSPEPLWPLILDSRALNPYQYAGADPLRHADPSGLDAIMFYSYQYTPEGIHEDFEEKYGPLDVQIALIKRRHDRDRKNHFEDYYYKDDPATGMRIIPTQGRWAGGLEDFNRHHDPLNDKWWAEFDIREAGDIDALLKKRRGLNPKFRAEREIRVKIIREKQRILADLKAQRDAFPERDRLVYRAREFKELEDSIVEGERYILWDMWNIRHFE